MFEKLFRLGEHRTDVKTEADEGYFLDLARQTKVAVTCPVMVVGGLRSPQCACQVAHRR